MPRLRRSDCSGRGLRRRRAGKGFVYLDQQGERIQDPELVDRIKALAIPPAWKDVWICPQTNGHIQATGLDDADRKQYIYHEGWSRSRAARKFESMLEFAEALPRLRRAVDHDLDEPKPTHRRALACGIRLIDRAHFRIGSEQYAAENETYGAATLLRTHVATGPRNDEVTFDYPAKGSLERKVVLRDAQVRRLTEALLRRRSGPEDFLVCKSGRRWVDVTSGDLNSYIQEKTDGQFSAKDFRTWSGTVLAAVSLSAQGNPPTSGRGRERRIRQAIEEVAEELGNTPAVAKESYVDPRVLDLYRNGERVATSRGPRWARTRLSAAEKRVLLLLQD